MPVPSIPTIPTLGRRGGGVIAPSTPLAATPAPSGTQGTAVYQDASTVEPTVLAPDTGSGYATGDVVLCFTTCNLKTAAVATPAGWTLLGSGVGTTSFKIVLFAKIAASTSEAAPSLSWSGLTTGTSGTMLGAVCQAFANLNTANIATIADVVGASANGSSSSTAANGGAAITTSLNNSLIIKMSARGGNDATSWTAAGYTPVTPASVAGSLGMSNSSGSFGGKWLYKVLATAGVEAALNVTVSGGAAHSSMGLMIALKAA